MRIFGQRIVWRLIVWTVIISGCSAADERDRSHRNVGGLDGCPTGTYAGPNIRRRDSQHTSRGPLNGQPPYAQPSYDEDDWDYGDFQRLPPAPPLPAGFGYDWTDARRPEGLRPAGMPPNYQDNRGRPQPYQETSARYENGQTWSDCQSLQGTPWAVPPASYDPYNDQVSRQASMKTSHVRREDLPLCLQAGVKAPPDHSRAYTQAQHGYDSGNHRTAVPAASYGPNSYSSYGYDYGTAPPVPQSAGDLKIVAPKPNKLTSATIDKLQNFDGFDPVGYQDGHTSSDSDQEKRPYNKPEKMATENGRPAAGRVIPARAASVRQRPPASGFFAPTPTPADSRFYAPTPAPADGRFYASVPPPTPMGRKASARLPVRRKSIRRPEGGL